MTKAVEKAFEYEDDEEGAAKAAARLGPDGGPAAAPAEAEDALDELEDFESEDAWLDEELSDEELAALGEEDFEGEEIFEEDLSLLEDEDLGDAEALEAEAPAEDADAAEADVTAGAPRATAGMLTAAPLAASDEPAPSVEFDAGPAGEEDELDARPVPRISIHAFCETPQTTALLERAAVDRRLSKAHLTMHMGGIAKAVDHFQSTPTPNLIILETLDGGPALFEQLGELAQVCDPSTKVVIIGRMNDIGLYRELIRQGVSDYLVRPRSPLQIIKAIAALYIDPSAPPIGRTIAFVGARGGVGSSTLAHNVAWCSAEEHQSDTVILDLDLPFGTASLDFEQDPTSGLIEALSAPERLDDVLLDRLLQKHTDRLSLFTAPNLLDRDYDLDDQAFETVIDVVRGAAPTIVIDVPHMWTSWSKRVLQTADEIVITAAPDLASFRNTKNLVDVISAARPNDAPPTLVLNQFDPKLSSVQPEQYAEHVGLKPALVIGWEPQLFHTAATNAAPIFEVGAKTKTAQGLRDLTTRLLGRADPPGARAKFSLIGLFRKR
ncbi:AAA family ATPase [Amphiplicatus metriothermophilus]|uniref:Pilus assembly protein CpaE n=1 Tax=Amphiplicatus metriothermophilus TaxID=1519374 RepID=A0A239PIM5_9PROT|nr:AAA family ATPase [Amphiplicatus metriothermophilus]MBB5518004.1 pilus assembly protein CpaE [Amphiplicatus metriothermophilus]SNT67662.1 pilus assembly protein CpaE [Amphiplicatus metriothermophilus]